MVDEPVPAAFFCSSLMTHFVVQEPGPSGLFFIVALRPGAWRERVTYFGTLAALAPIASATAQQLLLVAGWTPTTH